MPRAMLRGTARLPNILATVADIKNHSKFLRRARETIAHTMPENTEPPAEPPQSPAPTELVADTARDAHAKPAEHDLLQAAAEGSLRADAHRELRAMLLSVHPCPPLPMIARGGEDYAQRVISSHDFLATAIDRMLLNPDVLRDTERRDSQLALCEKLSADLANVQQNNQQTPEQQMDETYQLLCSFSRNYVALYFDKSRRRTLDIRFTPWRDVCCKDPVHTAACSHLRAFKIMQGEEPSAPDEHEDLAYDAVLLKFCTLCVQSNGTFKISKSMILPLATIGASHGLGRQ